MIDLKYLDEKEKWSHGWLLKNIESQMEQADGQPEPSLPGGARLFTGRLSSS